MPTYQATVTFRFTFDADAEKSAQEAVDRVASSLRELLDSSPVTYRDGQLLSVNINSKKTVKRINVVKEFTVEEVFSLRKSRAKKVRVGDVSYEVRWHSDRYALFERTRTCAACGLVGSRFLLEQNRGNVADNFAYFILYAVENGNLVKMTIDHIKPRALGGLDSADNYECLCEICNSLKASFPIGYEAVKVLRDMAKNLSSRRLRREIAEARLAMVDYLTGQ